jgi:hypothetical protein
MLRSSALHALALGLLVLGCGGGDDDESGGNLPSGLAGMYQTLSTTTSAPCDAEAMPDDTRPAYFQIKDEQSFGESYVAVYPCDTEDPSSCDEFADIDFAAATTGGAFESDELSFTATSEAATSCSGEAATAVITATSGGVTITRTSQTGTLTGADLCKVNRQFSSQQETAIKALPCTSRTTTEGQRL